MISRRRLLLGGIGVVGVAGLAGWGLGRVGLKLEIVAVLKRRLDFLKLDEKGVQTFATDRVDAMFNKKIPTWNRLRYHFGANMRSYPRFYRSADARSRVVQFEDAVVQLYLLSSSFFINGTDESRLVEYVGYYDPLHPCQNPFARQVVVATT
jgi:hypothetical protein